jgi:formylglycine-generating enzyme required for sulfatase activity
MGAQKQDPDGPNYDPEPDYDESPVREVHLETFQIGRYPVTVEEYRRFVEEGEGTRPREWEEQLLHPNRPVVRVTWYQAAAWCAWAGGRLPTEAEWERAARGSGGRRYPWGNEPPDPSRVNYHETKVRAPTPVGLFPRGATPEGIQDLAGNVDEWVADWYGTGTTRSVRGGSWVTESRYLRASDRRWFVPEVRGSNIGFRCARDLPKQAL